jgi:hypothetical protein
MFYLLADMYTYSLGLALSLALIRSSGASTAVCYILIKYNTTQKHNIIQVLLVLATATSTYYILV